MNEELDKVINVDVENWSQGIELVEGLYKVTRPNVVYGKPVTVEDQTVILASEVHVGLGFGHGFGGGSTEEGEAIQQGSGVGGGGGGGGASSGRPVAAIVISPSGVRVEPVFDATKIVIAIAATVGSIFMTMARMRRSHRR